MKKLAGVALLLSLAAHAADIRVTTTTGTGSQRTTAGALGGRGAYAVQCTAAVYFVVGNSTVTASSAEGVYIGANVLFDFETTSDLLFGATIEAAASGAHTCLYFRRTSPKL